MCIVLPDPCLVVLIGPAGSGKSTLAARLLRPTEIVSSDACRALVADDPRARDADADAFALVHRVVGARLRRGLSAALREYCVVAMLTTTRMWRQLRSHAIGAVNVGGTRARVRESIALCAPTAGAATVSEALRVAGLESQDARG